jgi:hypothetical protein
MKKTTNVDLVTVLKERNKDGKYDALIARASENGYHDFKCDDDKYPDSICPKTDLVNDLASFPELSDIRQDVMDGVYDESPDAEDKARMEEEMPFLKKMFGEC